jgi:putative addiction module component (TIGR02574 family)
MKITVAQNKINLAQRVLQTEDRNILKAIELIFTQENEHFELTDEQKRELDKTLDEVESGKAKFYTMAEVRKRIQKSKKKPKQ